ncbi:hypothetical protein [Spiroplasma endosymbiont of Agriotes lineatus]
MFIIINLLVSAFISLFTTHKNMYTNKCEQLANEYEKLDEYLYKYHYRLK